MSSARDRADPSGARLIDRLRSLLKGQKNEALREAVEDLIEDEAAGGSNGAAAATHERDLIQNIVEVRELTVTDLMVPRADIVAVPASLSLNGLMEAFARHQYSRIPAYRDTLDDVAGFYHIKDVLVCVAGLRPYDPQALIREALVVSPSMRPLDLLLDMRRRRTQLALVVDEFGGIDGLITIEDVVEAIVGEIEDEHTRDLPILIQRLEDGTAITDARLTLEDLEEQLGADDLFSEADHEEVDTLGGLVFRLAGRIPARGDVFEHGSGLSLEVLEVDARRIRKLKLHNLPAVG